MISLEYLMNLIIVLLSESVYSYSGTGRLVTAAPFDIQEIDFGISMSNSPYNGEVSVTTKFSDRYWFHECK